MGSVSRIILLSMWLLMSVNSLQAASQYPLFEASVPIEGRDENQRNAGMQAAMRVVLSRLVAVDSQAGQTLVQTPSRYITEYRYSYEPITDANGTEQEAQQQLIEVSFDANAILSALRREKVPLWDGLRPDVLVWFVSTDSSGNSAILHPEMQAGMVKKLQAAASNQGLTLTFPLMDLSDNMSLRVGDITRQADSAIMAASERYNAPVIVSGELIQTSSQRWQGRWYIPDKGVGEGWSGQYDSEQAALADFMRGIYARLFPQYATTPTETAEGEQMLLEVTDLDNLQDFARVSDYLASLGLVLGVDWVGIDERTAKFAVRLRSSPEMLERNLALDGQLELIDRYASPPRYRLNQ